MVSQVVTLGIGGYLGHDANAALMIDGKLIAAAQEERFTRKKHDAEFPYRAIAFCLEFAGISADQVNCCIFAEKPFQTLMYDETSVASNGLSRWAGRWLRGYANRYEKKARALLPNAEVRYAWHHLCHAAGAFYTSECERAAFLVMDGKGEDLNASVGVIDQNELKILLEQPFEDGLGLFYSLITAYLGFHSFGSEYKVMGLAPYGKPVHEQALRELIETDGTGYVRLRFPCAFKRSTFPAGIAEVAKRLGHPIREGGKLEPFHLDIASSLQKVFEDEVANAAKKVKELTGEDTLLFSGGCAQNCVSAGKLRASGIFSNVYNSPVAGDMASGLGAALLDQRDRGLIKGTQVADNGYYLGGLPGDIPAEASAYAEPADDLCKTVSDILAQGKIVAWCRGRMELGARALGARSILADARVPGMQSRLNLAVKFRESFRPFAPIVLEEHVGEWFDSDQPSRFMQFVMKLKPELRNPEPEGLNGIRERLDFARAPIASVVHVDYSARVQTVSKDTHPDLHQLLSAFHQKTGIPILINTSFNVSGEPIVRTAEEAWNSFVHTDIDYLVIQDTLFRNPMNKTREEKLQWVNQYAESA